MKLDHLEQTSCSALKGYNGIIWLFGTPFLLPRHLLGLILVNIVLKPLPYLWNMQADFSFPSRFRWIPRYKCSLKKRLPSSILSPPKFLPFYNNIFYNHMNKMFCYWSLIDFYFYHTQKKQKKAARRTRI